MATKLIKTNVLWMPELPNHWGMVKVRHLFSERNEKGFPDETLLVASQEHGVVSKDVYGKRTVDVMKDFHLLKLVEIGDFVISLRSFQGGIELAHTKGIISPAYTVLRETKKIDKRYFKNLFKSLPFISLMTLCVKGIREGQNIDYPTFKNEYLPLPSYEEQIAISEYLDKKNEEIEKFIRNKERLIELLEEERKSIVFKIILSGTFNHNAFKDSGVSWIGKIPETWQVRRFFWEVIIQEGPGIMAVDFKNDGIPLLRISGMKEEFANLEGCNFLDQKKVAQQWNHFKLNKGDILISASASTDIVCEVSEEAEGAIPYTGVIRLTPRFNGKRLSKKFLKLYISSKVYDQQVELLKEGSTIQHYGPTHLKGFFLFLPTIKEQAEIVEKSRIDTRVLDLAISKAQKEITAIKEYRESLITDLVLGKQGITNLNLN